MGTYYRYDDDANNLFKNDVDNDNGKADNDDLDTSCKDSTQT